MSRANIIFAVYRMDETENGLQEFRIISLTDESGLIDLARLQSLEMNSLRQTFSEFQILDATIVRLAGLLECNAYVCLSLPEYNRLVSDCTDLDMLQESMQKFAKPLRATEMEEGEKHILSKRDPESDQKKGWMGRIFS